MKEGKMFKLFKKRKAHRKVFGFLCDKDLSERVRRLSALLEVPIYCLVEHLLQLGLAHVGLQMSEGQENMEQVKKEMQDHLVDHHLLVRRLGTERYEKEIVREHAEMTAEQKEMVKATLDLVFKLGGEKGVSYRIVIGILENMAKKLEKRQ